MSEASNGIPPEPSVRSITPAREDHEPGVSGRTYVWPLVWCAIAAGLIVLLSSVAWPEYVGH